MINKILTYFLASLAIFALLWDMPSRSTEHVSCIELNYFHDTKGNLAFTQVILWEITPTTGKFQVRAWCMVNDREASNRRPVKNEQTGIYQVDWYDAGQKTQRKITSRLYRESWTVVDPERDDLKRHPNDSRISLSHRLETPSE